MLQKGPQARANPGYAQGDDLANTAGRYYTDTLSRSLMHHIVVHHATSP